MRNRTLTSILLERVTDEIPYKIEVNFKDSNGKGKEYEVYAKNMYIAIHKVMYLFHSESSKDLKVSNIEKIDEDTYKVTVTFANSSKDYEVFADDEDEAKTHALYSAKNDLKVYKVNGKDYEFADDFDEDRYDVNDSLDYEEGQWKK